MSPLRADLHGPRISTVDSVSASQIGSYQDTRGGGMQTDRTDLIVVCGAGGFIGGHLVADFRRRGHRRIRAVDVKPFSDWYQLFPDIDNACLDLRLKESCET